MSEKKPTPSYSAEFRERGVRLYREHRSDSIETGLLS